MVGPEPKTFNKGLIFVKDTDILLSGDKWTIVINIALDDYPLSYGVPVRERYGSTLLPATREQHDQNCTQSH